MKNIKKIILTIIVLFAGVFVTACGKDKDKGGKGQTPVYQGMVISGSVSQSLSNAGSLHSTVLLDNDKEKNPNYKNGHYYHDHNGCEIPDGGHAGDSEDRNDNIDEDQPFEEENPPIEDKVEEELVIGADKDIYYATVNEDIYVTIKLSNPDNYEIMSFTLNGKKYSNYMFEEGSDMENLILKVNVGSQAGIKEYTIDAIKYVDGTEIKDVLMDGDKTVKAGIRTNNMVTTFVTNQEVTLTSISFDLVLGDGYSLIEHSNGQAKVILFDGNSVLGKKDVAVGNNEIEFTGLTPNTLYQYAIAATYDDLSGEGLANHVLYKDAFYTDTIVLFKEPTITQTSITWDYLWDNTMENKTIVSQELYLDDEKVRDVDVNSKTINDLLSNRAYTIKTTYKNLNNENEVINLYFVTQAKAIPTVEIVDVTSTQTSISFDIDITDTDNVGELTKLELLRGNDAPIELELNQRTISDLLSNNEYTIRATYTYDLNDGEGTQTIIKEATITTNSKVMPTLEIVDVTSTQTSISFDLDITDTDNVGELTKLELLRGNDEPVELALDQRIITNLLSNNEYTIRATYTYDLNDGYGAHTFTKEASIITNSKVTPVVEITDVTSTQTSISFDIDITDTDNVGELTKLELLHGNDAPVELELDQRTISDLLSNNEYTIRATYTCDLNDGTGSKTIVKTASITTNSKTTPVVEITGVTSTQTSISFDLDITDTDNVGELTKLELLRGNDAPVELELDQRTISDLLSNNEYKIRSTYTYDLNDGEGEKHLVVEKAYATLAKEITVTNLNVINNDSPKVGEEVQVRIYFDNPSNVQIHSFYINGIEAEVLGGDRKENAIVKFTPDTVGGEYKIELTEVKYLSNNILMNQSISSTYQDIILVLGELIVEDIDSLSEIKGYSYMSDTDNRVVVTLSNPTGYTITSVNINDCEYANLDIVDQNHIIVDTYNTATGFYQLKSITYGFDGGTYTTKVVNNIGKYMLKVSAYGIYQISTPNDLKNMMAEGIYELVNDIDMINEKWEPKEFKGIFIGNGYSIKNLTIVKEQEAALNSYQYGGLFSTITGFVTELAIENIYISLNVKDFVYVGALAGKSGTYSRIEDCYATGDIVINGRGIIGGLVGFLNTLDVIESSYANVNIRVTNVEDANIYGLVGSKHDQAQINNSYAAGNITINAISDNKLHYGGLSNGFSNINNSYVLDTQMIESNTGSTNGGGTVASLETILNFVKVNWNNKKWKFNENKHPVFNKGNTSVEINSVQQFMELQGKTLEENYVLKTDLDLGGIEWNPINLNFVTFDGNGYKISNFKITKSNFRNVGIFGQVTNGTIKNLTLNNFIINVNEDYNVNIGSLIGYSNGVRIFNCFVKGNVIGESITNIKVGGFIGLADYPSSSSIYNSYMIGNVYAKSINSSSEAGGLVGLAYSANIYNSYYNGNVESFSGQIAYAGGMVASGFAMNCDSCYVYGSVKAQTVKNTSNGTYTAAGGFTSSITAFSVKNSYSAVDVHAITDQDSSVYAGAITTTNGYFGDAINTYKYSNQEILSVNSNDTGTIVAEYGISATMEEIWAFVKDNWDSNIWNIYDNKNPTLITNKEYYVLNIENSELDINSFIELYEKELNKLKEKLEIDSLEYSLTKIDDNKIDLMISVANKDETAKFNQIKEMLIFDEISIRNFEDYLFATGRDLFTSAELIEDAFMSYVVLNVKDAELLSQITEEISFYDDKHFIIWNGFEEGVDSYQNVETDQNTASKLIYNATVSGKLETETLIITFMDERAAEMQKLVDIINLMCSEYTIE